MKKFSVVMCLLFGFSVQAAVIANVGEKAISDDQLRSDYSNISPDQRRAVNEDMGTKMSLIDNAVNTEVLVQAAKKAGLDRDDDYRKALDRFQRQYLSTKFMQKTVESKLTNSELKKFFDENKGFFDTTQVCASHIVVKTEEEAKKLADDAKKKGANFEQLAKKNSLDPSVGENKGNLGCFTRDRMVPEFSAAAFNMKKGEVRGPVRTMFGYHVIKVSDVKGGKVPNFAEVEQKVKETLRLKLVNETLTDLRAKSNVKVNESEAKSFKL